MESPSIVCDVTNVLTPTALASFIQDLYRLPTDMPTRLSRLLGRENNEHTETERGSSKMNFGVSVKAQEELMALGKSQ